MINKPKKGVYFRVPEQLKAFIQILNAIVKNDTVMYLIDFSACFEVETHMWVPVNELHLFDLGSLQYQPSPNLKIKLQTPTSNIVSESLTNVSTDSESGKPKVTSIVFSKFLINLLPDNTKNKWDKMNESEKVEIFLNFVINENGDVLDYENAPVFSIKYGDKGTPNFYINLDHEYWKSNIYKKMVADEIDSNLIKKSQGLPEKELSDNKFKDVVKYTLIVYSSTGSLEIKELQSVDIGEMDRLDINISENSTELVYVSKKLFMNGKVDFLVDIEGLSMFFTKMVDKKAIVLLGAIIRLMITKYEKYSVSKVVLAMARSKLNPKSFSDFKIFDNEQLLVFYRVMQNLPSGFGGVDVKKVMYDCGFVDREFEAYFVVGGLPSKINWWYQLEDIGLRKYLENFYNPFYFYRYAADMTLSKMKMIDNLQLNVFTRNLTVDLGTSLPEYITSLALGVTYGFFKVDFDNGDSQDKNLMLITYNGNVFPAVLTEKDDEIDSEVFAVWSPTKFVYIKDIVGKNNYKIKGINFKF